MELIYGIGVSGGRAGGKLFFVDGIDRRAEINREEDRPARENDILECALKGSAAHFAALSERCTGEGNVPAAVLFDIYRQLTEESSLTERMKKLVFEEKLSAEQAVRCASDEVIRKLSMLEDPYIKARAEDIRDITEQVRAEILHSKRTVGEIQAPVIVAAKIMLPSMLMSLDRSGIAGIVTSEGSRSSHAAILACSMGIPLICGLGDQLKRSYHGADACMNGSSGILVVNDSGGTQ